MSYIYEKNKLPFTGLYVVFDAGSIYEKSGKYGTFHLMEHLICKNVDNLDDLYLKNGLEYNAQTNSDMVQFYLKGLSKYLTKEIKEDFVKRILSGLNCTEEEFNLEKNVVINEYKDYFNNPSVGNGLNDIRKYFNDFSPIGKLEDIQNFTYEDAKKCAEEYFREPSNIIEVGPDKTKSFNKIKYSSLRKVPSSTYQFGIYQNEFEDVSKQNKASVEFISKKFVTQEEITNLSFGLTVLIAGFESPWTKSIRVEKGLTYGIDYDILNRFDKSILTFGCDTEIKTKNDLITEFKRLISNIDNDFTKERFETCLFLHNIEKVKNKIFRYERCTDLKRKEKIHFDWDHKLEYESVKKTIKNFINEENLFMIVH